MPANAIELQVIALATDPAAFTLGAVQSNTVSAAGALGTLSSFNRAAQHAREAAAGGAAGHQTDVLAMLNTRIARETQELSELHARIARERERWDVYMLCYCCICDCAFF